VIWCLAWVVFTLSVTALGAWAASDAGGHQPCGDVSGQVVDAVTGVPLTGVSVSLLLTTRVTDGSGRFCFKRVPSSRKIEMSLINKNRRGEVTSCSVFEIPARFYPLFATDGERVAARIVEPGADGSVRLSLERVAPADIDPFCVRCHRWNPCLVDDSLEQLVQNRKFLRGLVVSDEEVEEMRRQAERNALSKETYGKIRYTDTHANSVDMGAIVRDRSTRYAGRYQTPKRLKLLASGRTSCDTCHTRHVPTDHGAYAVLPFKTADDLCTECHVR
jgi:hypothetical protein